MKKQLMTLWMLLLFVSIMSAQTVSRLVIINASTNAEIKDLPSSGETIDLDVNPLINFRAVTDPEPLTSGKCVFKLTYPDGQVYTHSEGTAVYACFGDYSGNYLDWESGFENPPAIQAGDYTLEVTPGSGTLSSYAFTVKKTNTSGGEEGTGDPLNIAEGEVLITGETKQWHNITLNFGGAELSETSATNPFSDYRLQVDFTNGTKTLSVPGYFAADGNAANTAASSGNVWKVHFCPPETGEWDYTVSYLSGDDIAIADDLSAGSAISSLNGKTGNITVNPSDKTGRDFRSRGRLSYVDKHYLQLAGSGEYFLKVGPDSPENFLAYNDFDNTPNSGSRRKSYAAHLNHWRNSDPTWRSDKGKAIIGTLNYLASKGLNSFSFLTMNINGDDKNVYPYINTSNKTQFDVSKLDQWAIVFEYAQSIGLHLHFKTQECENERLLDDGDTGIERKLYYRELIARFGHNLALNWNLGEENGAIFRVNNGKPVQSDAQRIAMAEYFHQADPYQNHIVLHTAPGDYDRIYTPLLGDKSKLTGLSVQTDWANVYNATNTWLEKSKNAGKQWVVANDEQGPATWGVPSDDFVSGQDSKGNTVPNKHQIREKVLWGNLMAGGAGVEYYFGYDWSSSSDLTSQEFTSRNDSWEYCKHAYDFFNQYIPFWEMTANNSLTSGGHCLAKANAVYVVYLPSGGTANVNLGSGTYSVSWYNPKSGGELTAGLNAITGGSSQSIGNSPDTSQDWIALIRESNFSHNGNSSAPLDVIELPEEPEELPAECGDPITLSSFNDFLVYQNIDGYKNAYKDNGNQCLAINAVQFKNEYAAAQTIFNGESGAYNITLTTLTEIDGESSYRLWVNNVLVGEYQNPETTTDYAPSTFSWANVTVNNGDVIQVDFNSHSNDKVLEGDGSGNYAYSRGRWTSVRLGPVCTDCTGAYIEEDGVVVIEPENVELHADWRKRPSDYLTDPTMAGSKGNGWIEWTGPEKFATTLDDAQVNGISTITFIIEKEGDYTFRWRSKQYNAGQAGDQGNDTYVKFETGTPVEMTGSKGAKYTLNKFTKAWVQSKQVWSWATNFEPHHGEFVYSPKVHYTAGTHQIKIGGRSKGHSIDRIVLFHDDVDWSETTFTNLSESKREGCDGGSTPIVPVADLYTAYDTVYVFNNDDYSLRTTLKPDNASDRSINWFTRNSAVANVSDQGMISAQSIGETMITAISNDNAEIQDSCLVIVLEDKPRNMLVKDGWTAIFADSESTAADGDARLKEHAIDGDLSTFWHTEWKNNKPALPHEIQVDFGAEQSVDFIDYYPRQDAYGPNGAIGVYEVYLSNSTSNWGNPVKKDYIRYAKNASQTDYKDMQRIFLANTASGRYLKLKALTEAQNDPTKPLTAIAELELWAYGTANDVSGLDDQQISVYPNPFNSVLNVKSDSQLSGLKVFSIDGRAVYQCNETKNEYEITSANFKPGVYVITVLDGNSMPFTQKVIKN